MTTERRNNLSSRSIDSGLKSCLNKVRHCSLFQIGAHETFSRGSLLYPDLITVTTSQGHDTLHRYIAIQYQATRRVSRERSPCPSESISPRTKPGKCFTWNMSTHLHHRQGREN